MGVTDKSPPSPTASSLPPPPSPTSSRPSFLDTDKSPPASAKGSPSPPPPSPANSRPSFLDTRLKEQPPSSPPSASVASFARDSFLPYPDVTRALLSGLLSYFALT